MYWKDNHGTIYGPFSKQEDGFPNAGEVVRQYRMLAGFSQRMLVVALGVHRSWVIRMENENAVPELLSRRRHIADLLHIPPVLLGVSVLGSDAFLMPLGAHSSISTSIVSYSIQEANAYLDAVWDLHRLTGSLEMLATVQKNKVKIAEQVSRGGPEQQAYLELLHRYEHFLLVIGRNRQDDTVCDPLGLIDVARQTDNPDALGISLYRRGKWYFKQQNYGAALEDIREALSVVEHADPQVKGTVLSCASTILAHHAADQTDVREVLALLEKAEKYIDLAKGSLDPFHCWLDKSGYSIARANALTSLLRINPSLLEEVFETLDLAQACTLQQHIQRKADIEGLYAEATFQVGDYTPAVAAALEALELARSIHSVYNIRDIQKLYEKLSQTKFKDSSELRELKRALAKK